MKRSIIFFLLSSLWGCVWAQKAKPKTTSGAKKEASFGDFGGIRFATDINYFHLAKTYPLVDGKFSSFALGGFYRHYREYSGMDIGLRYLQKRAKGGLPLVMQDFRDDQQTSFSAVEAEIKVGPRFGVVNPRIGYLIGYRFQSSGFIEATQTQPYKIAPLYMALPFGLSADFPTNYGQVGVGVCYNIGLTNVIENPGTVKNALYDGGKQRSIQFEITTTFGK